MLESPPTNRPIVYANMSTQPITVTRAQSGFLFFKADRIVRNERERDREIRRFSFQEQVGHYMTDVYNITDLNLISRKRYVSSNHVTALHCVFDIVDENI